ncbi:amidohydrolase family protein [Gallaecimonas mangrovi]|uniref:amidohydrolase family protein n=1 Tax=Gallaecimonas mangrovi TaxID=2291597 RepID=UPI000E1FF728|nr:amidohydrolase family protein [Gallaecimonas mangrovi]
MNIIALEEHFVTQEVLSAWHAIKAPWHDPGLAYHQHGEIGERLLDLGERRIADMAATGINMQVLSLTAPALHSLEREQALALQGSSNNLIAEAVKRWPQHFQGLATLATPDPQAAAAELHRSIRELGLHGAMLFGHTRGRNLDHPDNWPIFEAAQALGAPLYIHPQAPVPAVREALYSGFDDTLNAAFASFGLGWHYETGVQIVRMVLAGVFDRFPELQIVTGHWGEVVLFYLERIDSLSRFTRLQRPINEYFRRNLSVTPSGMWSERYLKWAIEVLGTERILFSSDYPYRFGSNGEARRFLETAPISAADKALIAHGNWQRLTANIGHG